MHKLIAELREVDPERVIIVFLVVKLELCLRYTLLVVGDVPKIRSSL